MITYEIHPVNPQRRLLELTARILKNQDGIAAYPTDTVYGIGAAISNLKALDRISNLLHRDKSNLFSFICSDFSQLSNYVRISNSHFKLMKRYLPGPYTFILPATNLVPKRINPKRKTVGIRIPNYPVVLNLVEILGEPLANTSIPLPEDLRGDPDEIKEIIGHEVDVMLDAGTLENPIGSTIVDLTTEKPVLVREGKGIWNE